MSHNPLVREVSGIEYRVCLPDDTTEVGRLLAESFTSHDPPAVAVGLTPMSLKRSSDCGFLGRERMG